MRKSKVLEKLRNNETVFCFKSTYADPDIVELMGHLDIDVVWICNEHLEINPERIKELSRAGRASNIDIMLRRTYSNYSDLIRALEAGVTGLMIPHCKNAAMAKEIVSHVKFYPEGIRGYDGVNSDSLFGTVSMDNYMPTANNETFLMLQIEDVEAIDEIDAIAEIDGVDIIFVGPSDLSHSMGIPGDVKNPKIKAVIQRVVDACRRNGKWSGTPGLDSEYTKELIDLGVNFIPVASDYGILKTGFEQKLDELKLMKG
ncbi:MAG: aldolase/citrate lyase family protein [Victivallaceae bacterium]|nr:aldolase/citrate lyase family protein [Victivallaceae bacterium]